MFKLKRKFLSVTLTLIICMGIVLPLDTTALQPTTATVDQYQRVDLNKIGGVAGERGGLNYYKGKVPIGGNIADGGKFTLPWFSSNVKHTQFSTVSGNNFKANVLYVLASGAWWQNHLENQPVLKFTIKGSATSEHYLISGVNFTEWNAGVPATIARNSEKIGIVDQYCSGSYITRYELPTIIDVSTIDIELVNQTKANNSRLDNQPAVELYGMTLAIENVDTYNLNPQFNAKSMDTGTIGKYKKLDVGLPTDIAGLRGGETYFKDKVPVGGNTTDGGATYLPWFSSNPKHVQKRTLASGSFKANTMYVLSSCSWWTSADTLVGKPLISLRLNNDPSKEMFIVSGVNTWEWNAGVPDTIASNSQKISIRDVAVSSSYITKFEFPDTVVDNVNIDLISPTAANYSIADGQQLLELYGVTLGYEGTGNFNSTPVTQTTPTLPSTTITTNTLTSTLNGMAIDVGVKLWWDAFIQPNSGYRLYRSTTQTDEGISVTDFPIQSTIFVDANVKPKTTYYYKVRALIKEANPLAGEKEILSEPLNVCVMTTKDVIVGDDPTKTGSKNFILMKLDDPYMTVAGQKKEVDPGRGTAPIIMRNRTVLPIRSAVEAMGGTVEWVGSESKIIIKCNNVELLMWLGKKEISVNGVKKEIDVAPESINGRTMIPVRFVAENLKAEIEWIASTREIVVIYWS